MTNLDLNFLLVLIAVHIIGTISFFRLLKEEYSNPYFYGSDSNSGEDAEIDLRGWFMITLKSIFWEINQLFKFISFTFWKISLIPQDIADKKYLKHKEKRYTGCGGTFIPYAKGCAGGKEDRDYICCSGCGIEYDPNSQFEVWGIHGTETEEWKQFKETFWYKISYYPKAGLKEKQRWEKEKGANS